VGNEGQSGYKFTKPRVIKLRRNVYHDTLKPANTVEFLKNSNKIARCFIKRLL
jgi:hypothetical protein